MTGPKATVRVGIDLGTTHTVLAYAPLAGGEIQVFPIPQTIAAGEVAPRPLLPSLRFHAAPGALAADDLLLPWPSDETSILGTFARELGQQTPGRLVASAKSWLSHPSVDRTAAILPWGAPDDVAKVSPLDASASYLRHLRQAWDHAHPHAPLARQQIVLTVPASFDDGARELTLQAATLAGLPEVHLIEEPQAAVYDWVHSHQADLAGQLAGTHRLLVVDVGGGTTDLTLIDVTLDAQGLPQLSRTGVGDHLVLGGDNMDLALARWLEPRLSGATAGASAPPAGVPLTAIQLAQLTQRCRSAKERLLAPGGPAETTVTLQGGGSRLIGGARSATLTRADLDRLLVDGFFPQVAPDAVPLRARGALVEFGLPYASDAAITRHIAAFLRRHGAQGGALPDTVLLNGGVFHAEALRQRLLDTLNSWRASGTAPVRLLATPRLDAAVARGAVAYAMARAGAAPRIRSGTARAYYLVLQDGQGICLLPHGTPEGEEVRLQAQRFSLRLGRPVRFHLATSLVDRQHRPGDLVDLHDTVQGEFLRLPPIATVLHAKGGAAGDVQVQLGAQVTEVGTLQMHCVAVHHDAARPRQRWQLQFQLRGEAAAQVAGDAPVAAHPRLQDALAAIARVYGDKKAGVDAKEVRQLRATLERLLGERTTWDAPLLRTLFGALLQGARRRRRSLQHERTWFNLAGFLLRPGFGDTLDGWRMEQMWALFGPGIAHSHDSQQWSEWWLLWRRIAGGLHAEQQEMVFEAIAYYLQPPGGTDIETPEGPPMLALDELLRMAASFERISVAHKTQFGRWLLQRLRSDGAAELWWALGRLGARQPLYASLHHVLPPDVALDWLAQIGQDHPDWARTEPAAFAVAQLAQATGDRARDLPEPVRQQIAGQLVAAQAAPSWAAMVREVTVLDEADTRRVFGEALPPGLVLLRS